MIVFKFSMLISLLQSNQVYYTESGEKCQSECDWSELSNGSSFVRNCLNINGTRSRCSLLKSMFDISLKPTRLLMQSYVFVSGECSETEFQCKTGGCKYVNDSDCNGSCIPKGWVQDGMEDCDDGSDEVIGKCNTMPTVTEKVVNTPSK